MPKIDVSSTSDKQMTRTSCLGHSIVNFAFENIGKLSEIVIQILPTHSAAGAVFKSLVEKVSACDRRSLYERPGGGQC